jgi:epoxyqueuosine reductase
VKRLHAAIAILLASSGSASIWQIAKIRAAEFAQMPRRGVGVSGSLRLSGTPSGSRGSERSFSLTTRRRGNRLRALPYPGPEADALLLIPPAVVSGLGELGKHGSLISRHFGAGVLLAGITTDMPLVATAPDRFGGDEFCMTCQICTEACPPGAIAENKQMVRGVERWYVDFDKCIPYFAEAASCGICIAICPWTRPDLRPKLLTTMARRLNQTSPET